MIVTCENCEVKYFINESELDDNGRIVRCTFCEHEWLLYHPKHYEHLSQLPPKKLFELIVLYLKSHKWVIGALIIALAGGALFFIQQKSMIWSAQERAAEYFMTQHLEIDVISYKIEEAYDISIKDSHKWLLVTATIRNGDNIAHKLETVRVIGLNYNQQEVSHLIVSPEEMLQSGESTVITIKVPIDAVTPSYIKMLLNKERDIELGDSGQSKGLIKIGKQ